MNILIVGAAGYVGSALYRHLEQGHKVVGVDRLTRGNPGHIPLASTVSWDGALTKKTDAVIWVAGTSSVPQAVANPRAAWDENVTKLLDLAAALTPSTRLIYASSGSVYNTNPAARETDKLAAPVNAYDASKIGADLAVPLVHAHSYGLRFGTVCGPSSNMRDELMLNAMVRSALKEGVVRHPGETVRRSILAIDDLLVAVSNILKFAPPAGVYNLASFNGDVRLYARAVENRLSCRIDLWNGPASAYDFGMNIDKAREHLKWRPAVTLEMLVNQLVNHYRA